MPLFQPAPVTAEEMEKSRPPELLPDQIQELDEAAWYEKVYKGDAAPQLTLRSAAMGAALGFFLAFTNVYVGLKIGWHLKASRSPRASSRSQSRPSSTRPASRRRR